jgi:hypothetical protein
MDRELPVPKLATRREPHLRLLEMLSDRFGALEAVAHSSIELARYVSEDEIVDGSAGRGGGAGVWE